MGCRARCELGSLNGAHGKIKGAECVAIGY